VRWRAKEENTKQWMIDETAQKHAAGSFDLRHQSGDAPPTLRVFFFCLTFYIIADLLHLYVYIVSQKFMRHVEVSNPPPITNYSKAITYTLSSKLKKCLHQPPNPANPTPHLQPTNAINTSPPSSPTSPSTSQIPKRAQVATEPTTSTINVCKSKPTTHSRTQNGMIVVQNVGLRRQSSARGPVRIVVP
jgi:hypothetical protein